MAVGLIKQSKIAKNRPALSNQTAVDREKIIRENK